MLQDTLRRGMDSYTQRRVEKYEKDLIAIKREKKEMEDALAELESKDMRDWNWWKTIRAKRSITNYKRVIPRYEKWIVDVENKMLAEEGWEPL